MFGSAVQLKPEPVHYKNTNDALGGLFSGDVQAVFATVALAAPQVKAGKLVALGSTGAMRTPSLPDVPTIGEQGYPALQFNSWFGIVAPAKTPRDVVARLQSDIVRALQQPDSRARLEEAGFRVTGTTGEELARIMRADTATWGKAVAATGFRAD
jgi:tripartite-type tricarboxylate transporter receptor subunit TctC